MQLAKLNSLRNTVTNSYNRRLEHLKTKLDSITLPERFKGTIVEKWADYWKTVSHDYYEVCCEVARGARNQPKKTVVILSGLGLAGYCIHMNPDDMHYRDTLINYSNKLMFVGPTIRNPKAVEYLKLVESSFNHGTIRRFSCGLFSVVWIDNYDRYLSLYKAMCPYLKPELLHFHERVIDIGFLNKWWIIEDKLKDFDINPNEWENQSREKLDSQENSVVKTDKEV